MGFPGKREGNPELEERCNVARSKPESKPVAPKALRRPSLETGRTNPNERKPKHRTDTKVHGDDTDGGVLLRERPWTMDRAACSARNGASAT